MVQYRNSGAKEGSVPGHCHIVTIYESGREEDPSDVFLAIINSDEEDANERPNATRTGRAVITRSRRMLKKVNSILFVLVVGLCSEPGKRPWKRGCEMVLPKTSYVDSFQDPTRAPVKIRYGSDQIRIRYGGDLVTGESFVDLPVSLM